jgi:isoleucyl-tRNA synthetase
LDKDGRKMSKHLGNVLEPMPLMNQHGADAVRWYMLAAGSPWSARRVGHDAITDVVRKTLLTYWNTISFFTLYANAADFEVTEISSDLTLMDRWILSELNKLIAGVDLALENFDSQLAGSLLATFIDDLSNWYVRRSRRRFWDGDPVALNTLYFCLKNLTLLLAPMVPFISEHVWQSLIRVAQSNQPESVHLADFPISDAKRIDENLSASVSLSRRLVELGRSARAESGVKIRQPLSRALVSASGWEKISEEIKTHIADELNIQKLDGIHVAEADLVDVSVKANFRTLGTKFGAEVQDIAKAITEADHTLMVKHLRENKSFEINLKTASGKKVVSIDIDDLVVTETPRTGWSVASHAGESLALDLALTPELIQMGVVREVIRAVQEERKRIGLDISDRITVNWNAPEQIALAIIESEAEISSEVLATKMMRQSKQSNSDNELGLWLELIKS